MKCSDCPCGHESCSCYVEGSDCIYEVEFQTKETDIENKWILKDEELPSAYEEVEILMFNGDIHRDMIIRGKYGNLEWRNWVNKSVKAWRYIK